MSNPEKITEAVIFSGFKNVPKSFEFFILKLITQISNYSICQSVLELLFSGSDGQLCMSWNKTFFYD